MNQKLHIIGAGGHAKVIIALAESLGYQISGIYDDDRNHPKHVLEHKVTYGTHQIPDTSYTQAVIAIGDNKVRKKIADRFQYITWITLIHPTVWKAPSTQIQRGSVIMAGAILQPDVYIGEHAIINTSASIDHNCLLQDYVHIAPGSHLAGNVDVCEGAFLGVGTSCIPCVSIGSWSTIGAGAVVSQSIPSHSLAVGVPAKVIKQL